MRENVMTLPVCIIPHRLVRYDDWRQYSHESILVYLAVRAVRHQSSKEPSPCYGDAADNVGENTWRALRHLQQ